MPAALQIFDSHHCGDCTACCTHLPIGAGIVSPEAKPAGQPCNSLCNQGCGIYQHRPKTCVDFRCAWLKDPDWPEAWRPDESGLLCLREMLDVNLPASLVYEIRNGALSQPAADQILAALVQSSVVVSVVSFDQQRRLLPGHWQVEEPALPEPAIQTRRAA